VIHARGKRWAPIVVAILLVAGWAVYRYHPGRRVAGGGSFSRDRIVVVQWNVENLFDTVDDPAVELDDEFTPAGWRRWTEERYRSKLANLAKVLLRLDGDVVCLQEVENRRVLDDLNETLGREASYPYVIHRDGTDHRGMDVALLSRAKAVDAQWYSPVKGQRDILAVELRLHDRPLNLIVCHWKSRWGGQEATAPTRMKLAATTRDIVDGILARSPGAAVMVVGDFNDNFDDPSVTEHLLSIPDRDKVIADADARLLYNLHAVLPPEKNGTFYYRGGRRWNSFDTMSASRGLLTGESGFALREDEYAIVAEPFMMTTNGTPSSFRKVYDRKTKRRPYREGYSDHFPVRAVLTARTGIPQ
jgi:hypothetical protein